MTISTSARAIAAASFLAMAAAGAMLPAAASAQGRVLGGFNSVSTDDARVQGAAAFLAGQVGGELASVDAAQSQSTGNTNYRLEITLEDGARWSGQVTANRDGSYAMMGEPAQLSGETDTGTNDGSDTSGDDE